MTHDAVTDKRDIHSNNRSADCIYAADSKSGAEVLNNDDSSKQTFRALIFLTTMVLIHN